MSSRESEVPGPTVSVYELRVQHKGVVVVEMEVNPGRNPSSPSRSILFRILRSGP